MHTPVFLYLAHKRAVNLKRDLLAVAAGYCNATPDPLRGGYPHWRCARGFAHRGDHRYRNYVWSRHDRQPRYDPEPVITATVCRLLQQPHERYAVPTIRQTWAKSRFLRAETRRRRRRAAGARAAR